MRTWVFAAVIATILIFFVNFMVFVCGNNRAEYSLITPLVLSAQVVCNSALVITPLVLGAGALARQRRSHLTTRRQLVEPAIRQGNQYTDDMIGSPRDGWRAVGIPPTPQPPAAPEVVQTPTVLKPQRRHRNIWQV